MRTIEELGAEFDYWHPIERVAFQRRSDALGLCTHRYAAIFARQSVVNPSSEETQAFDAADAEWRAAKLTIQSVVNELRAL
jgi:hypothetical protein